MYVGCVNKCGGKKPASTIFTLDGPGAAQVLLPTSSARQSSAGHVSLVSRQLILAAVCSCRAAFHARDVEWEQRRCTQWWAAAGGPGSPPPGTILTITTPLYFLPNDTSLGFPILEMVDCWVMSRCACKVGD